MCLPSTQVDQFYRMWLPLLNFVNDHLKVVPSLSGNGTEGSIDVESAIKVRDALWKNVNVLDQFITNNPVHLSPDDLSILDSWRYHRQGSFIIFKALKKHAILISQDKKEEVYAVKGIKSSMEELFGPYLPMMIECVLLPFQDEIITDGLFRTYNITFGSGIKRRLKGVYDDAKERGDIIASLSQTEESLPRESLVTKAETINAKVLEAFQKHLYTSGLSQKTVARDIPAIEAFGQTLLNQQPEPASLRNFEEKELKTHLQGLPVTGRKTISISLKRFISFLRDTDRLDWEDAESFLEIIKRP